MICNVGPRTGHQVTWVSCGTGHVAVTLILLMHMGLTVLLARCFLRSLIFQQYMNDNMDWKEKGYLDMFPISRLLHQKHSFIIWCNKYLVNPPNENMHNYWPKPRSRSRNKKSKNFKTYKAIMFMVQENKNWEEHDANLFIWYKLIQQSKICHLDWFSKLWPGARFSGYSFYY